MEVASSLRYRELSNPQFAVGLLLHMAPLGPEGAGGLTRPGSTLAWVGSKPRVHINKNEPLGRACTAVGPHWLIISFSNQLINDATSIMRLAGRSCYKPRFLSHVSLLVSYTHQFPLTMYSLLPLIIYNSSFPLRTAYSVQHIAYSAPSRTFFASLPHAS